MPETQGELKIAQQIIPKKEKEMKVVKQKAKNMEHFEEHKGGVIINCGYWQLIKG